MKENKELFTYVAKSGDLAITKYKKIKSNDKYSLLSIDIETGKKNQIRVQLSNINHPIVGDNKYGIKDKNYKRLMLHAKSLVITNPIDKKKYVFEAKVPEVFDKLVQ